jgi:hypothetical protein
MPVLGMNPIEIESFPQDDLLSLILLLLLPQPRIGVGVPFPVAAVGAPSDYLAPNGSSRPELAQRTYLAFDLARVLAHGFEALGLLGDGLYLLVHVCQEGTGLAVVFVQVRESYPEQVTAGYQGSDDQGVEEADAEVAEIFLAARCPRDVGPNGPQQQQKGKHQNGKDDPEILDNCAFEL